MSTAGNWIEISVQADPLLLEELSPGFFKMGCQGINEYPQKFILYFQNALWDDVKKAELAGILDKKNITPDKLTYASVEEENWNEKWKENFKTFRVGNNIIVQPDWENYRAKAQETVLTISPKMAFGTGHHETTQLILKQLETTVKPGMCVLDAGTGTAILAIAAALLGARKIIAFDIDPVAIENARENVLLNNVSDTIELKCGTLDDIEHAPCDLIIANINRNVLLLLAAGFKKYAKKGTTLLLSGLLVEDKDSVLKEYTKAGWQITQSDIQGEWLSLNFEYLKVK